MKLIPRLKSISFITIYINFASSNPQNFHQVDKYIENFEYVTDDISVPKDIVTEKAFIGDYFESPRRNVLKNNDEEFEAIKKEYLKELKEHKASELNKIDVTPEGINKANVLRKSHERNADDRVLSRVCGADKTETLGVMEGPANIESFPWLGVLVYPRGKVRLITTVILVTINTVIGSALDIERLPKLDFRKKSKVILGQTCKHPGINVLDYNYHPDYGKETYSSVVLIQIDLASVSQALWPICGPPKVLKVSKFYTITLPNDCRKSKVEIFSMDYVKPEECKHYYRRTGLDLGSIWPKHGACGKAHTEDECVWRNGAALVVKQRGRWHLMGIGVNGPGCAAPSRYVDYAAYNGWVTNSVARIGRPALTRLADNHLILRRTINNIQRYGPCDANEVQTELFCDRTNTTAGERDRGKVRYNLTLIEKYDYTCIALKANSRYKRPKISLKGVCDSPHRICYSANRFVLDFYIEIAFHKEVWFKICVYGKLVASPDPKGALKYFNGKIPPVPIPWGLTPTGELDDPPPFGFGGSTREPTTTPTLQKQNGSSSITPPESTTEEFVTTTPITPTDDGSSSETPPASTEDEISTLTSTVTSPVTNWTLTTTEEPQESESTYPSLPEITGEFWTITPIWPKDTESPYPTIPEPTGEFWSITPIWPKDTESPYPTIPEPTGEFWSITPIWPKDTESPYPTIPEPTGEFWSITPIWPNATESPYPTIPEPTGEFWSITPIWPKDTESPYPTIPEPTGELWSVTPIWPKDTESPYPTIPEPTGEFWSITPIWPKDTESPYPTIPEPTGEFWSVTPIWPKDTESPYPTIPEPTGELWSVTPIWPKDTESPYPTIPEPTGEFWSVTPIWPKDTESPYPTIPEPTGEFWSVTPIWPKDTESPYPTIPEHTGEFWSITPIWPQDTEPPYYTPPDATGEFRNVTPILPKDTESLYPTLPEPPGEFWSVTPIWPEDTESPYPTIPEHTGEFWSVTPIWPNYTESPHNTIPEPTGEFWSVTPIWPKDTESDYLTLLESTGEFWSATPIWSEHTESPYPTIPEPTGEFWSVTPLWPKDTELEYPTLPEPTGEFWSITPIWPQDTEPPYYTPPDATGEFWDVTPILPKDTELPYPKLPEPTEELSSVNPIWSKDTEPPYYTPPDATGEFWDVTPILPKDTESDYLTLSESAGEFWSITPIWPKDTESDYLTLPELTGEFWSETPISPRDIELPYLTSDATGEFRSVIPVDDETSPMIPVEPTALGQPGNKDSAKEFLNLTPVIPEVEESSFVTPMQPIDEFWSITLVTQSVTQVKTIAPDDLFTVKPIRPTSESYGSSTAKPQDDESLFGTPIGTTYDIWSVPTNSLTGDEFSPIISIGPKEETNATLFESTGKFSRVVPTEPRDEDSSNRSPIESTNDFLSLTPVILTNDESSFPVNTIAPDDSLIEPTSESWSLKPAESVDKKSSSSPIETTGEIWSSPSILFTATDHEFSSMLPVKVQEEISSATPYESREEFQTLTPSDPRNEKSSFGTPVETASEFWTLPSILLTDDHFSLLTKIKPKDDEISSATPFEPTGKFIIPAEPRDDKSSNEAPIDSTGEFINLTPVINTDDESVIPVIPDDLLSLTVIPIQHTSESSILTLTKPVNEKSSFDTSMETASEFSLPSILFTDDEFTPINTVKPHDKETFSATPVESSREVWSSKPFESEGEESSYDPTGEFWSVTPILFEDKFLWVIPAETTVAIEPKDDDSLSVLPIEPAGEFSNTQPYKHKDGMSISSAKPVKHTENNSKSIHFPKENESESVTLNNLTTKSWITRPITHKYNATFADPVKPTVLGKPKEHEISSHSPPETSEESWSMTPVTNKVSDNPKKIKLTLTTHSAPTGEWKLTLVTTKSEKPSAAIPIEQHDDSDELHRVEPTGYAPDKKYPITIAFSDILTFSDQTAPSPDKTDTITSFTEEPLQPWWTEYLLATAGSPITTGKEAPTPDTIGVTDDAYDSYLPWWTEVSNTEDIGTEDVFTKEQDGLGPPAIDVITVDKDTEVNYWGITPVNKEPGYYMPSDGEVLMVPPDDTAQGVKVTSMNEHKNSEEFDMFWAVTQLNTDLLRNDANRYSSKVTKSHGFSGIVSEELDNRWNTEESVAKKQKNKHKSKKAKTVRPEHKNTLFSMRNKFKNKIKNASSKKDYPQTAKNPLLKKEDPNEVNQLEKLEKTFEEIMDVTLLSANLDSQGVTREKKTDMTPVKTSHFLRKGTSLRKKKLKSKDVLSITPVSMPVELKMVTTKIVSSEEDNRDEIFRVSNFKHIFKGDRIVKPHLLSPDSHRQPFYLRNLVTRGQILTQKSGLNMREAVMKWKRPNRPGGFINVGLR